MYFIGLAVREEVLLQRPGLRVIFMSGYADTQLYKTVIQCMCSIPQKPFSSECSFTKS